MAARVVAPAVIHIAGLDVQVGARLRQRCAWCGAVLLDYDLTRVARPLEPGEDPDAEWRPATWEAGALVEVDGPGMFVVPHEPGEQLPPSTCAHLDDDVTGTSPPG